MLQDVTFLKSNVRLGAQFTRAISTTKSSHNPSEKEFENRNSSCWLEATQKQTWQERCSNIHGYYINVSLWMLSLNTQFIYTSQVCFSRGRKEHSGTLVTKSSWYQHRQYQQGAPKSSQWGCQNIWQSQKYHKPFNTLKSSKAHPKDIPVLRHSV